MTKAVSIFVGLAFVLLGAYVLMTVNASYSLKGASVDYIRITKTAETIQRCCGFLLGGIGIIIIQLGYKNAD